MINKAIEFALNAHQGQVRKGTEIPYVTHPLALGIILAKVGCPDDVIVAGILHDVLEDTPVTLDDLKEAFGTTVANIVEGASEPDKSLPWEERKKHTLEFLGSASQEVRLVALADKLDNIEAMAADYERLGEALWDRFRRGRDDQKWYYEGLLQALRDDSADEAYTRLHGRLVRTVAKVFQL